MKSDLKQVRLGVGDYALDVFPIGLGCMGMSEFYGEPDHGLGLRTLQRAYELGVTLFDTSDMYAYGLNESLVGDAVASMQRDKIVVATKGGVERKQDDPNARVICGHPDYLRKACDESLRRLKTDYIDLYYLQRIDPQVPLEDSIGALSDLVRAGKIRHIGLSEVDADTIRKAHTIFPLTAVQSEFSLYSLGVKANGALDACRELQVGFVASVPLCRGLLSGRIVTDDFVAGDLRKRLPRFQGDNLQANLRLVNIISALAKERGCCPGQLALAWLLAVENFIVPLPGAKHVEFLEENVGALDVYKYLSDEDIGYLYDVAFQNPPVGGRATASASKAYGFKD
ncbi:MAG: aldo/keto reductase [Gammaproteobacteria bacterium]|nr:aldo/keto reductase [Gammaproteobacteria bacterium]